MALADFDLSYKRGMYSTRVELFQDRIRITRGKKDVREAKLSDIKSVHYYAAPSRYDVYHCFWIDAGETRLYIQGAERHSSMTGDKPFQASVQAVLDLLVEKCPDVPFSEGAGKALRITYFLTGAIGAIPGIVLALAIMGKEPVAALIALALSFSLGSFAWAFRPWKTPVTIPIGDLRDAWASMMHAPETVTHDGVAKAEPVAG